MVTIWMHGYIPPPTPDEQISAIAEMTATKVHLVPE